MNNIQVNPTLDPVDEFAQAVIRRVYPANHKKFIPMKKTYYLEIQTSRLDGAGTDSNISIQFISLDGTKTSFHVLNNDGNDFEKNNNDFYQFDDLVGSNYDLATAIIKHDGAGASSSWRIKWLKVSLGGKTWKGAYYKWINNETITIPLKPAIGRLNWMSAIEDSTTIDQINIPGTHDSGTSYLNSANYHHTQDLNIWQQLLLGIRYFDIRLSCTKNPNWDDLQDEAMLANFKVYHAGDWCYLYFDQDSWIEPNDRQATKGYVLQDMLKFLKENPSEFILLQIQEENNSIEKFADFFKMLIERHNYDNNSFLITNTYPTYKDAKSKIVILNMNNALGDDYGITLQGPKLLNSPTLYVENHWMDSNKELKWDKVATALNVALQENPGQWVITFVSDGSGALPPREFAKYLNQWVEDFIQEESTRKHYGTILLDFPTRSLVSLIIAKYLQ